MPDWKFTAADTVADSGLHARLLVGRRIAVGELPRDAAAFDAQLAADRITLYRGDERIDEGVGANVLDGPLHALSHFLGTLRDCPGATDLQPGDIVTTGTWTDAWPVHRGEQWRAEFGAPLAPLSVRFT
jgi:2-keto-4-pentenoate hydratase